MKLYTIKKDYINFLKVFDARVPNVDYGDRLKPFIGIVLTSKSGYNYFCPLTSYKPKFTTIRDSLTFMKIKDDHSGQIYGALKFNTMVPVPIQEVIAISEDRLDQYATFSSANEKVKYWRLLNMEIRMINKKETSILKTAELLYDLCISDPEHYLHKYCLDFNLLELKCKDYEMSKAIQFYPAENINQLLAERFCSSCGKFLYPYDQKLYLIDEKHKHDSLKELDHHYGASFFDAEYENYAQFIYRNISEIKNGSTEYTKDEQQYLNIYDEIISIDNDIDHDFEYNHDR